MADAGLFRLTCGLQKGAIVRHTGARRRVAGCSGPADLASSSGLPVAPAGRFPETTCWGMGSHVPQWVACRALTLPGYSITLRACSPALPQHDRAAFG